jgi:hypothetical protein
MYEVRWTDTNGGEHTEEYVDENVAIKRFDDIKDVLAVGYLDVDSVGVYHTDGDGDEKELLVWAR